MSGQLVIRYSDMLANLDGTIALLAELAGQMLINGDVVVAGTTYRFERELKGSDGARGGLYRRFVTAGWQVLVTAEDLAGEMVNTLLREPATDRAKAELEALQFVTRNRSSFGTPAKAALVWQAEDGTIGEPVAICDGGLYPRGQAARLRMADEVVDWTWVQEEVQEEAVPVGPQAETPALVADLLSEAYQAATAAFADDKQKLIRLADALAIVKRGGVQDLGNGLWKVDGSVKEYEVNGKCGCADFQVGTAWCEHRLAVALVRKVEELGKKRAGSAANTPAPAVLLKETTQEQRQNQHTTKAPATQAPTVPAARPGQHLRGQALATAHR